MTRIAKPALAAAGLVAGLALASPAQAQRNGLYNVAGVNPDGSAYTGQMIVQQVGLASWRVAWQVGGNRFEGYGMSAGPVFSVGFILAERPGIAIYQTGPDGTFTGQWTLVGSSAIGTENLTPFDPPRADQPRTDQPRTDQPRPEQPRADQPRAEQPRAEQPRAQAPATTPPPPPPPAPAPPRR